METIQIRINGQDIETTPGKTILEVVREKGLDDIPTLCHSDELEPLGSCFLCVVEIKGRGNLVPACATRVSPGMDIETRNARILDSRKTALELLLSNHWADCVSPCRIGCPAGVDAQGYVAYAAMGRYREAVDLIREANPLPAICGRVCVRKCEVECRRTEVDTPVGINAIKRFLTDQPGIYGGDVERGSPRGQSVGIVGAGPAGLTAAWFLGRLGYETVLYEAMPKAGGMIRYGIPTYRLPDDVIDREIEHICKVGARIVLDTRVGVDLSFDEIRSRHDALFIAAGAWTSKGIGVPNEQETEGVLSGIGFLREKYENPTPIEGTVAVVGGGNTAMDVARTSQRLGARKVILVYRRTRAEMPADKLEIEDCVLEGVEIMELVAPVGLVAEGGRLRALRCIRMTLGEPDRSGRRRPMPLAGSEFDLPCDLAISAIGQGSLLEGLSRIGGADLRLTKWGTVAVDQTTLATSIPGVFAGGDVADDGPTVVIDAIADGGRAARSIHAFLSGESLPAPPFLSRKDAWSGPSRAELGDVREAPRHEVHSLPVEEREGSFSEVATGFDLEDKDHEVSRCLSCGCVGHDDCDLRKRAEEYGADARAWAGQVRRHRVDDRHPYIVYDPNKCVLCCRCIRTCARVLPISALGLVNRGFRSEMRPAMNDPLVETNCVSCGNCVDSCPTAALTIKYPFAGRACLPTRDTPTHCGFCSLGCPITVRHFGGDRYFVVPRGSAGHYLCRYGRFGHELFIRQARITGPTLRKGGARGIVSMEGAVGRIAESMGRALRKYGPEAAAVFVSPELTNEQAWLAGRVARQALGTGNIGSLAILSTGIESDCLDASFGFTGSTSDRSCLVGADLVICNNTSMTADHLVLAVDVIDAVHSGARLIVANSILDPTDRLLSTLAVDPMRGRASAFWNAVAMALLECGFFHRTEIGRLLGGADLLAAWTGDIEAASLVCGVPAGDIRRTAELVQAAWKIVIIHSPDRPQDQAPGDLAALANLIVLLRSHGIVAHLLLPAMAANRVGLEMVGVDPAFALGRLPAPRLPGASSHEDLRRLLSEGSLRTVLVIGEDPMAHDRTARWFRNVEFMAAMDWTDTETTRFADVSLPGTTFLEEEGTRCTFEGQIVRFQQAVRPPSDIAGWQVLDRLGRAFGLPPMEGLESLAGAIEPEILGYLQRQATPGQCRLVSVDLQSRPPSLLPPLTHCERYKKEVRELGARFKVR